MSHVPLFIWVIICLFLNGTNQVVGLYIARNSVVDIFSALGVLLLLGRHISFKSISYFFVGAVALQCIIAIANFLLPAFGEFVYNIQFHNVTEEGMYLSTIEHRLTGLGATFFYAGIVNGYAIIFLGFLISCYRFSWIQIFLLSVILVITAIIGTLMARTTLTGLLIFPFFFINKDFRDVIPRNIIYLISCLVIFGILSWLFLYFNPQVLDQFSTVIEWGFEFLFKASRGNGLETESTNQLKEMYFLPSDIRTYFIGDGLYEDPSDNTLYYMGTDVGYLRILFYLGLPGIIFYFLPQFVLFYFIRKKSTDRRIVLLSLLLIFYGFVLNFKGLSSVTPILLVIYFWLFFNKEANTTT